MRHIYSIFLCLLFPLFLWSAIRRYLKSRDSLVLRQLFALSLPRGPFDVWIHAVSVGESRSIFPLIKKWQTKHPSLKVLMTTSTPTGAEQVRQQNNIDVTHCYLPFDYPWFLKRFLKKSQPKQVVIVETELWPNLFATCKHFSIPITVVNARLSEKSSQNYLKFQSLFKPLMESAYCIYTRDTLDTERFLKIAPNANIETLGNIKFDLIIPKALPAKVKILQSHLNGRTVWMAASTHDGEESLIIEAHKTILNQQADALLILAPRHPERTKEIFKLAQQNGLSACCRSDSTYKGNLAKSNLLIIDVIGELLLWYGVSTVAFVGGSWVPKGGHNFMEAVAMNCAVITGPYLYNFEAVAKQYQASEAITIVNTPNDLSHILLNNMDTLLEQKLRATQIWEKRKPVVETLIEKLSSTTK